MIFRRKKRRSLQSSPLRRSQPTRLARRRPSILSRRRNIGKTLSLKQESTSIKKRKPLMRGFFAKLKRWIIFLILGGIIFSIIYNLFLSSKLDIQTIAVFEDQQPLPEHPLNQVLQNFKGDNLLLLNTEKIQSFLQKKYPYYATIKISKNLPNILILNLETHPVVANLVVKTPEEKKSLILNAAGQSQNSEEGITYDTLPTLLIERDQPVKEGAAIISQNALAFVLEAIQNFEDKFGMKIDHAKYLEIPREVHLFTERNFYIWLDLNLNLDEQLNKLKKALPRLNIYEKPLEYIDLRIAGIDGEKVIFKTN